MSGIAYYPPTTYFQNINFNNDFYAIPNNNQGISLAYANTHYLFSTGVATSTAISTYFSGSVGIGTISSTAGTLNALTLNAINSIQINGTDISTIYATKTYVDTTSNSLQTNINTKLNISNPTTTGTLTAPSITAATSIIYKGAEISSTYLPLNGGGNITNGVLTITSSSLTLAMRRRRTNLLWMTRKAM